MKRRLITRQLQCALDSAGAPCQAERVFFGSAMLESLKSFLSDLAGGTKSQEGFAEDDYRLAAAALLVHVSTIDGDLSEAERQRLHDLVKYRFDLDEPGTEKLIDAAIAADREAVDLYHF